MVVSAMRVSVGTASALVCLLCFTAVAILAPEAFAAENSGPGDTVYVDKLIAESARLKLHLYPYWRVLLHYKRGVVGLRSLVDDPRFFISPDGKTDPAAELSADLRGFFEAEVRGAEHPRCRFPARFAWLKERLSIDDGALPPADCSEYGKAFARVNPASAVFVFPTAFMNRPASLFGHTFIRIDNERKSKLLAHAVNYSAHTEGAGGVLYSVRGVFGGFKGYYSIMPYYEKVKEYGDIDQRDMWEYNLNLSKKEMERMFQHIWELKDIYTDYYFFDENCSYMVLFLLEAARPGVNLTDDFLWVIPLDTVRAVGRAGLVESIDAGSGAPVGYRPSKAASMRRMAAALDDSDMRLAGAIWGGELKPSEIQSGGVRDARTVLDLAAETVQYKYFKEEISKDVYQERYLGILSERSKLPDSAAPRESIPETPPDPRFGHRSAMVSIGGGFKGGELFDEFSIRPAYHGLLDPGDGYMEGSQLVFAGIRTRYYHQRQRYVLEGLDLIDIVSIAPRDELFKPMSWKVATGTSMRMMQDGTERNTAYLNGGGGLSWKTPSVGIFYVFADGDLSAGPKFSQGDKYAAGAGFSAGVLRDVAPFWKLDISARGMQYFVGDDNLVVGASLRQSFKVTPNNAVTVDLSRTRSYDIYRSEARVGWNFFF
jgi:hypothetical protein